MWVYMLIALGLLPFVSQADPAPGLFRSKRQSQQLECERMTAEVAAEKHPGELLPSPPRGDYVDRTAVVCAERLMRQGLRGEQDEAILMSLDGQARGAAQQVADLRPDLAERTWLVEVHYPSAQVSAKVSFATQNALQGAGLRISDRVPSLAAGDIEVITRLDSSQAYTAACMRYAANGSLQPDDVLLAVVLRDSRETALHAGICVDGVWSWLQ